MQLAIAFVAGILSLFALEMITLVIISYLFTRSDD